MGQKAYFQGRLLLGSGMVCCFFLVTLPETIMKKHQFWENIFTFFQASFSALTLIFFLDEDSLKRSQRVETPQNGIIGSRRSGFHVWEGTSWQEKF